MKKHTFCIAVLPAALLIWPAFTSRAQELPHIRELLQLLQLANGCFMNKWPDVGKTIILNRERPSKVFEITVME